MRSQSMINQMTINDVKAIIKQKGTQTGSDPFYALSSKGINSAPSLFFR